MHKSFNPNPHENRVGDCTVRAISAATGQTWQQTYIGLCLEGYCLGDMPSANHVWGAYLRRLGFKRHILPDDYPDCYTVAEFCRDHPKGTYVLAISGHVVCAINGDWHDTWDSGDQIPVYYWSREE